MNSIDSILSPEDFSWGLPSTSQNFSQGGVEAITPSALRQSTTFQPYEPFQTLSTNPPQASNIFTNDDQRYHQSEDLEMEEEADAQLHRQHPAGPQNISQTVSRRSRYGSLDWDRYKEELRKLYLEENQNLDNTMRIVKERHSFPDSYVHAHMEHVSTR